MEFFNAASALNNKFIEISYILNYFLCFKYDLIRVK